ncbi:MAG: c-type cytochrome, partial [Terracidiphilus sp.]
DRRAQQHVYVRWDHLDQSSSNHDRRLHEGEVKVSFTVVFVVFLSAGVMGVAGCNGGTVVNGYSTYTGGNIRAGRALLQAYSCGACHIIPGVPGARGLVGPPLYVWAKRTYIAGELPNTPDNLVRWIESPPSVEPGTAMPALGVSDQQARDMAAYLYTLQ